MTLKCPKLYVLNYKPGFFRNVLQTLILGQDEIFDTLETNTNLNLNFDFKNEKMFKCLRNKLGQVYFWKGNREKIIFKMTEKVPLK